MTFWEQAYRMSGTFASKVILLSKEDLFMVGENKFRFFNRYVDVIECGAIIGLKYFNTPDKYSQGLYELENEEKTDSNAEIPVKTILLEQKKLKMLFRIVMLNEQVRELSLAERTDNAFRNETKASLQEENEELFNNFVALGVDLLYSRIKDARDAEACLDIMEEMLDGDWPETNE